MHRNDITKWKDEGMYILNVEIISGYCIGHWITCQFLRLFFGFCEHFFGINFQWTISQFCFCYCLQKEPKKLISNHSSKKKHKWEKRFEWYDCVIMWRDGDGDYFETVTSMRKIWISLNPSKYINMRCISTAIIFSWRITLQNTTHKKCIEILSILLSDLKKWEGSLNYWCECVLLHQLSRRDSVRDVWNGPPGMANQMHPREM